jgi:hypothetical protein
VSPTFSPHGIELRRLDRPETIAQPVPADHCIDKALRQQGKTSEYDDRREREWLRQSKTPMSRPDPN